MSPNRPAGVTGEAFVQAIQNSGLTIPETCEALTGRSFVAVRLPDGSIGTAMDYSSYGPKPDGVKLAHRSYPTMQILEGTTGRADRSRALFVALLGALSRPCYRRSALHGQGLRFDTCSYAQQRRHPLEDLSRTLLSHTLDGASSVAVVGFGGFMEMYAELDSVDQVLVCDQDLSWREGRVNDTIARLNQAYGRTKISLAGDLRRLLTECDVVQITASALCNGSMDKLLDAINGKPLVVVGPSGALVPAVWVTLGARLICTELRPAGYWWAYQYDDHLYEWFAEYDDRIYVWPNSWPAAVGDPPAALASNGRP
jgi:Putative heavy-metal chelation